MDVVESVLVMERDERDAVERWIGFLDEVEQRIVAAHGGTVRRKTGDGFVTEFPTVVAAVNAANEIHDAKARENDGRVEGAIVLRGVVDEIEALEFRGDLYGREINRSFRVMSLASPGATVVTAAARERLVAQVDADVEDLGERYLRHVPEPVRIYRVGPVAAERMDAPMIPDDALLPTVAFVPPTAREGTAWPQVGMVLCEEAIARLSRSPDLKVISRMSTGSVAGRGWDPLRIGARLAANYVVTGSFHATDERVTVLLELVDVAADRVLWNDRIAFAPQALLASEDGVLDALVAEIARAVRNREVQRVRVAPLNSLDHYTLMIGAITLMHRMSRRDFAEARGAIDTLLDRASRQALPLAWLGRWHVLRVQQGWSDDPKRDAELALDATRRSLDIDPDSALALVTDGFVRANLLKTLDEAEDRYDRALELAPSDPQAWLLRGTMHAFRGEGRRAVMDTDRALVLSPLDPHRFFFESLAATANLAAQDYERAEALARSSLRLNRVHTSTLRALGIAQWHLGQHAEARATGAELMRLEPKLTLAEWRRRTPSADYETGRLWAETLRHIGVPE